MRILAFILTFSAPAIAGCVRSPEAVRAAEGRAVAVVALLSDVEAGLDAEAPDAVYSSFEGVLSERGLEARRLPAEVWVSRFEAEREARDRAAVVAEASEAPLLLVLAAEVRYYAQMGGQWRWTVDADLVLGSDASPEQAWIEHVSVPVFLPYGHEREPEALVAALPVLERRAGALLDRWIRARAAETP